MQAIDAVLAARGLRPAQRPLNVAPLLWEAFRWEDNILPARELALRPGFEGQVLLAKAHQWYERIYAEMLKVRPALSHLPVLMGNDVRRARIILVYGRAKMFVDRNLANCGNWMGAPGRPATFNILCAVDGLTQELANRLGDTELELYAGVTEIAYKALVWRESLPNSQLLTAARADYDGSTEDVLGHRYAQARWGAQQAVEKTLKSLLKIAEIPFPTGGSKGHDLVCLAALLEARLLLVIDQSDLLASSCSPAVRYAEEPSTETQALAANHAVLRILVELAENPRTIGILRQSAASISVPPDGKT